METGFLVFLPFKEVRKEVREEGGSLFKGGAY